MHQRSIGVVRDRRGRDVLVEERTTGRVSVEHRPSQPGRWAKWDAMLIEELAKL